MSLFNSDKAVKFTTLTYEIGLRIWCFAARAWLAIGCLTKRRKGEVVAKSLTAPFAASGVPIILVVPHGLLLHLERPRQA